MKKFLKGQAAGIGIGFGIGTLVSCAAMVLAGAVAYIIKEKHAIEYLEDNESETEES